MSRFISLFCCLFATLSLAFQNSGHFNQTNSKGDLGNPAQVSLAFYYDYFSSRDYNINTKAIPSGVETVFGGNPGNEPMTGLTKTSMRLKPADLCPSPIQCVTVDNVIDYLQAYDYVHIDEISYQHPCPECADVIEEVGNRGYKGRIILFFRYSINGQGMASQARIVQLGMSGYLRKIFFEAYPSDHSGCSSYICTSTSSQACDKLITWKKLFASNYPGSNILVSPTYGLRSGVDLDSCSSDLNALTSFFSCMHNDANDLKDWKGAAFFGASSTTGCGSYSTADAATKCGGLLSWWNGK